MSILGPLFERYQIIYLTCTLLSTVGKYVRIPEWNEFACTYFSFDQRKEIHRLYLCVNTWHSTLSKLVLTHSSSLTVQFQRGMLIFPNTMRKAPVITPHCPCWAVSQMGLWWVTGWRWRPWSGWRIEAVSEDESVKRDWVRVEVLGSNECGSVSEGELWSGWGTECACDIAQLELWRNYYWPLRVCWLARN